MSSPCRPIRFCRSRWLPSWRLHWCCVAHRRLGRSGLDTCSAWDSLCPACSGSLKAFRSRQTGSDGSPCLLCSVSPGCYQRFQHWHVSLRRAWRGPACLRRCRWPRPGRRLSGCEDMSSPGFRGILQPTRWLTGPFCPKQLRWSAATGLDFSSCCVRHLLVSPSVVLTAICGFFA